MTDFTGSNTPAEHRDSWRTPPEIFAALNAEFVFQLDAAAGFIFCVLMLADMGLVQ